MSTWPDGEDFCPNCKVDLDGGPIPDEYLIYYGGRRRYTKRTSVQSGGPGYHLVWQCPECEHTWDHR